MTEGEQEPEEVKEEPKVEQPKEPQTEQTETKTDPLLEKTAEITLKKFEFDKLLKYAQCLGPFKEIGKDESIMKDALTLCKDSTLSIMGTDEGGIVFVNVLMKNAKIKTEGVIAIMDINKAFQQSNRYNANDELNVTTVNGKLYMERKNPNKVTRSPTTTVSNIESQTSVCDMVKNNWDYKGGIYISKKGFKCGVLVNTNAEYLKELVADAKFADQLKFPIDVSNNKFLAAVGDKESSEVTSEIPCTKIIGQSKTKLALGFCCVLNSIDNDVVIHMPDEEGGPVWIRQNDDKFLVQYFISPTE